MYKIVKFIIAWIFILGILPIGTEIVRWVLVTDNLNEEIEYWMMDSIELTLDEDLRRQKILYIDDCENTKEIFEELFKTNIRLDDNLNPKGKHFLACGFKISEYNVDSGSYRKKGDEELEQGKIPYMQIKATTMLEPFMLNFGDFKFPIKIDVHSEHRFCENNKS